MEGRMAEAVAESNRGIARFLGMETSVKPDEQSNRLERLEYTMRVKQSMVAGKSRTGLERTMDRTQLRGTESAS